MELASQARAARPFRSNTNHDLSNLGIRFRVAVGLEAGGTDETDLITNPNRWPMTLGGLDWGFATEPNFMCGKPVSLAPRGCDNVTGLNADCRVLTAILGATVCTTTSLLEPAQPDVC